MIDYSTYGAIISHIKSGDYNIDIPDTINKEDILLMWDIGEELFYTGEIATGNLPTHILNSNVISAHDFLLNGVDGRFRIVEYIQQTEKTATEILYYIEYIAPEKN